MKDDEKTKIQLIEELKNLRKQIAEFGKFEKKYKQTNRQFQRLEERYQQLFDSIPNAVVITDKDGAIIDCNLTAMHLYMRSRELLIGKHITEFMSPSSISAHLEIFPKLQKFHASSEEIKIVRVDGSLVSVIRKCIPFANKEGNFDGMLCFAYDSSKHDIEQHDFIDSQSDLNQILDAAIPLCVIGRDMSILRINNSFCSVFGMNKEDAVGKKCYELWHSDMCNTVRCPMRVILHGESHYEYEWEEIHQSGSKSKFAVTVVPYRDTQSRIIGIIENYTNISKLIKTDEALLEDKK